MARVRSKFDTKSEAGLAKLPARYNAIAFPLVLSGVMSLLVSGVATAKGLGITASFLVQWLSAWVISWPTAFVAALIAIPFVRRIVAVFVEAPGTGA